MPFKRLSFRAEEAELAALLDAITAEADHLGLESAFRLKLSIVLEELFLNTVREEISEPPRYVSLSLSATSNTIQLIYEDEGRAFDPFAALDRTVLNETADRRRVGGLGVLLIEGLAKTARYARIGNCNRIELSFARAEPPL